MIYSVNGELIHLEPSLAVIECAGVGYGCKTTAYTLGQLGGVGSRARLLTYLHVREDAVELYGFTTKNELGCFKLLIGVSGVGPKAALSILSSVSPESFALCVASGDYKTLTRAQGVGPKLAQRIVLELKDKLSAEQNELGGLAAAVSEVAGAADSGNAGEAIAALSVLGFARSEAAKAVSALAPDTPVEDMIKHGLRRLAGK